MKYVRVYFSITRKGRGKRAQALLQLLREQAETAQSNTFTLKNKDDESEPLSFRTMRNEPGVVYYDLSWMYDYKLPSQLAVLKPLRVVLTADGHFNFPTEGIYEGGGEVTWLSEWHNTYNSEAQAVAENTWKVIIEAATVEEAHEQLRRIRTGEASLKYRWINQLHTSSPQETGEMDTTDKERDSDIDAFDSDRV